MSKQIPLSNGGFAIVDEDDFEYLNQWKWKRHPQGYACRAGWKDGKWTCILMHRVIMKTPDGMEVDHGPCGKLDNRKCNLTNITQLNHRQKHIAPLIQSAKKRQLYPDVKSCEKCGKEYKPNPRKRKRQKCCSKECAQAMRLQARHYAVVPQIPEILGRMIMEIDQC
jgi:hypothetical protein